MVWFYLTLLDNFNMFVSIKKNQWKYMEASIYAVVYSNRLVVHRVKERNWKEGFLRFYSDNPLFGYVDVEVTDIHTLYQVTNIIHQKLG
jgi:hypothetical protein